ncbi:hypothetical protein [Streptomyces bauhiniae]|uniref:hypothetical protein n=1 Tax=Streptomyces bauhiniae TaxID=2340725 RepID=UPI00142EC519|nr:hypothetical protein [Streptomyces bauhiniae]
MPAYGRADSEWAELVEAGRDFLIEQARHRTLTHYTEFWVKQVQRLYERHAA